MRLFKRREKRTRELRLFANVDSHDLKTILSQPVRIDHKVEYLPKPDPKYIWIEILDPRGMPYRSAPVVVNAGYGQQIVLPFELYMRDSEARYIPVRTLRLRYGYN